jgi:hypothetical protein
MRILTWKSSCNRTKSVARAHRRQRLRVMMGNWIEMMMKAWMRLRMMMMIRCWSGIYTRLRRKRKKSLGVQGKCKNQVPPQRLSPLRALLLLLRRRQHQSKPTRSWRTRRKRRVSRRGLHHISQHPYLIHPQHQRQHQQHPLREGSGSSPQGYGTGVILRRVPVQNRLQIHLQWKSRFPRLLRPLA